MEAGLESGSTLSEAELGGGSRLFGRENDDGIYSWSSPTNLRRAADFSLG